MIERLRGRPWQRIRKRILERDKYLCQHCLREGKFTMANEIDHIVPLEHGGTNDDDQLQSLCIPHHRKKTASDRNYRPRRQIGLDGYPIE